MTELLSVPLAATSVSPTRPAPDRLEDFEQRSWRSLIVGLALLVDRLDQDLRRDHGLSFDEYAILAAVAEHPTGMSLASLGQAHAVSRPRLIPVLQRMQLAGWVCRQVGPWDPGSRVWATSEGSELVERAAPSHVAGLREYLLDHVDPEEFSVMGRAFHRLCDTLVNDLPA